MKHLFKEGDQKTYLKKVGEEDIASFHGQVVHRVCSTFALARDFEWTSRLFFLEMKEADEEGVGTHLSIDHVGPAFVGEEIIFRATVDEIKGMNLTCRIEATTKGRLVARGRTVQKMIKREKLKEMFSNKEDGKA
jgi:fluoroacetyl-CoA thioesterase